MKSFVICIALSLLNSNLLAWQLDFSQFPPLPAPRGGHAAATLGKYIIVAGGTEWSNDKTRKYWLDDCLVFDHKWLQGPKLPHAIAYSAYAGDGENLYLAGGATESNDLNTAYYISIDANIPTIHTLPNLPETVCSASATIVNRQFYVCCGYHAGKTSSALLCLDLKHPENGWKLRKPLIGPARSFSAVLEINKKLVLLGGMAEKPLNDAYEYDPNSDSWRKLADLPQSGYGWAACENAAGIILAGRAAQKVTDEIWLLDGQSLNRVAMLNTHYPTTTAPFIRYTPDSYLLIGGEPNSNRVRTAKILEIKVSR